MEATGRYSPEMAAWLLRLRPAWAPAIIQPKLAHDFIKSVGLRNRTNRLVARCLAYYGVERRPAAYQPPQPQYAQLRELVRFRRQLVEEHTAQANQAGEPAQSSFVRREHSRRLKQSQRHIARVEAETRAFLAKHPQVQRDVALLMSIDGIGPIVSLTLLAELGDLRRFASGRQLVAFTGLNPSNVHSGQSVHSPAHLFRGGNRHARHILYLAAMAAIRKANGFQQFYLRLLEKHPEHPVVALGAVMRKLLLVARTVLVHGVPFDPHSLSCGEPVTT